MSRSSSPRSRASGGAGRRSRTKRPWYRRPGVWIALLLPLLLLLGMAAGAFFVLVQSVPVPSDLDRPATVVLDADGEEVGELQREANREDVALASLPEHVPQAVLAAEDANFYEHRGVSVTGVVRALVANVRAGEVAQGGSTISQQYVKNFTGDRDRTYLRKVREAATAIKLEQQYSKDQILELYLNSIYFGRGAYGIQAAARAYFGVDAADLDVPQAAQLAGIIPAPSVYDPGEAPVEAAERYDYVIRRMAEEGWISPGEADELTGNPPEVATIRSQPTGPAPFYLAMVEEELTEVLGDRELYQGLEVRTHLDLDMQQAAQEAYDAHFAALAEELRAGDPDVTVPTGAMVSLEPSTGGIKALIGGPDYAADQFNLATGGPEHVGRQPGSTFKPFGLAAWISDGKSPQSIFPAPAEITFTAEESGDPNGWSPSNYGGSSYGEMTLERATWNSVNTVYAQVSVELGAERIVDVAQQAGIDREFQAEPSIVLGAQEVTPLELATGYNTFAAGGVHHEPTTLVEVTRDGERIFGQQVGEDDQRLSEQVAWTTVDVLKGVIEQGTGTAAQIGRPAFGKTGTTQDSGDAWFAGATPDLTTVVWMGNRDNRDPMPGSPTGGGLPARLWGEYMAAALDGVEARDFPAPDGDLQVVGTPAPTPTAPECPEGSEAVRAADGTFTCEATPEPTPTPTPTPEPTATPEPTPTPAPTASPPPDDGDDGGQGSGGGGGGDGEDGDGGRGSRGGGNGQGSGGGQGDGGGNADVGAGSGAGLSGDAGDAAEDSAAVG